MKITCLVENEAREGLQCEHGVAFFIEAPGGRVLFDMGQSGDALLHNAGPLGFDLAQLNAAALSHAHYDHVGGLPTFLLYSKDSLPLYVNPDFFRERYAIREGVRFEIGPSITREELAEKVDLRTSAGPAEIVPGVWTLGEIDEHPYFVGGSAHLQSMGDDGKPQPDTYRDDLSLMLRTDEGWVLLCGCCHAGLLNTLAAARQRFDGPIRAIVGGTHLGGVSDEDLALTVDKLGAEYGAPDLYVNHCTGHRAIDVLGDAFGDKVHPFHAGDVLEL